MCWVSVKLQVQCLYINAHEESCLLGYTNAVLFGRQRRCGGTCRLHLRHAACSELCFLPVLHAGFLLGVFFCPEVRGYVCVLRNVGWLSTGYRALYPRRQDSSYPLQWEPQILRKSIQSRRFGSSLRHFYTIFCISFEAITAVFAQLWSSQLRELATYLHTSTLKMEEARSSETSVSAN
jgi:hypothetical protein